MIDYQAFIESKSIIHNDTIDNYHDGLKFLINSESDVISYNKHIHRGHLALVPNVFDVGSNLSVSVDRKAINRNR